MSENQPNQVVVESAEAFVDANVEGTFDSLRLAVERRDAAIARDAERRILKRIAEALYSASGAQLANADAVRNIMTLACDLAAKAESAPAKTEET